MNAISKRFASIHIPIPTKLRVVRPDEPYIESDRRLSQIGNPYKGSEAYNDDVWDFACMISRQESRPKLVPQERLPQPREVQDKKCETAKHLWLSPIDQSEMEGVNGLRPVPLEIVAFHDPSDCDSSCSELSIEDDLADFPAGCFPSFPAITSSKPLQVEGEDFARSWFQGGRRRSFLKSADKMQRERTAENSIQDLSEAYVPFKELIVSPQLTASTGSLTEDGAESLLDGAFEDGYMHWTGLQFDARSTLSGQSFDSCNATIEERTCYQDEQDKDNFALAATDLVGKMGTTEAKQPNRTNLAVAEI